MNIYHKKSWISPKVEEKDSRLHGRGLFAKSPVKKGETVVIWGGEFVNKAEALEAKLEGKAVQRINKELWEIFDYETRNDDASYNHNHSCDPNTWMKDDVTIIARCNIMPGEELTIDYAMFVIDDDYVMPGKCGCGSGLCRKVITGRDWRINNLQEKYKGHFSSYLNETIKNINMKSRI